MTVVAVPVVFGLSPLDARPWHDRDLLGPLAARFRDGLLAFYDVPQPFPPAEQPEMHGIVLTAIVGFCLGLALALAARRPLVAAAVLAAGSIWPATLVPGADLERGALTLAAVLGLLALGGRELPRSPRPALVAGAVLVVAAVGASTSAAVAKDEFLDWRGWDPYDVPADPVGLDYVWDANYGGIEWPEEETKVLTVRGPERALYWRATTLDTFLDDRWIEEGSPIFVATGRADLFDPLAPPRARDPARWIQAAVEVHALRDEHVVGPSMPMAYFTPRRMGRVLYHSGGVGVVDGGLERGDEYTVWAYAPQPKPKELAEVRPTSERRNSLEARYLEIAPGLSVLPFGSDGRDAQLENLFGLSRFGDSVAVYEPLYETAREIVGSPRSPYAAVVALESWFRSEGGFVYDERPPAPRPGAPALVDFVVDHKRGYCQLYAGAMTLMLRYLGVPARVAVGFTSGDRGGNDVTTWTVTDRDAHAWVEVWFNGWGWIPFDPTPRRGQLSNPSSFSGTNFDAQGAADALRGGAGASGYTNDLIGKLSERRVGEEVTGRDVPGDTGAGIGSGVRERGQSLLLLLLMVGSAIGLAIAVGKAALRRGRYLTGDPRRLAAACRSELADLLADQGIRLERSATPRELRRELERFVAVDAAPFAEALEAARYGTPEEAGAAARRARRELRRLKREIRKRLSAPARLRGAVSLRSLAA